MYILAIKMFRALSQLSTPLRLKLDFTLSSLFDPTPVPGPVRVPAQVSEDCPRGARGRRH